MGYQRTHGQTRAANTSRSRDNTRRAELWLVRLRPAGRVLENEEGPGQSILRILSKRFNTIGERVWLKRRFKEYNIDDNDLAKLKKRMDIVPV